MLPRHAQLPSRPLSSQISRYFEPTGGASCLQENLRTPVTFAEDQFPLFVSTVLKYVHRKETSMPAAL